MTKQHRLSRLWLGGLALVLMGFLGVLGFVQDVRAAGDYSLTLRAPSEVQQYENTELTAVVKDSQGQPVNGVPVTFQVTPDWQKNARLIPNQVMTSDGTASTFFDADMPGVVMVTAQVGNTTETARITISGSGSRVYDRQP